MGKKDLMGQIHRFRELKTYSDKIFSFKQDKVEALDRGLPGGECTSLSLVWIKEKLTFSESSMSFSRLRSTPAFRAGDRNAIAETAMAASRQIGTNSDGITAMETRLGLSRTGPNSMSLIGTDLMWLQNKVVVGERITDSIETLATSVPKAHALLFAVKRLAATQAHAVAIYVSRGGTFYFFDPNAGIYSVRDIAAFFAAWGRIMDGNSTWEFIESGSSGRQLPYRIYS